MQPKKQFAEFLVRGDFSMNAAGEPHLSCKRLAYKPMDARVFRLLAASDPNMTGDLYIHVYLYFAEIYDNFQIDPNWLDQTVTIFAKRELNKDKAMLKIVNDGKSFVI